MSEMIYDSKVHPALARSFIAAGYSVAKCASEMGVKSVTFNMWKEKYPEFAEAVKFGQTKAIARIEQAVFDRAIGFEYEEKTIENIQSEDGNSRKEKTVTKFALPDVSAQKAFLSAYSPKRWGSNAQLGIVVDSAGNTIEAPTINITFTNSKAENAIDN